MTWSPVGLGLNDYASAFCVFNDGGGDALYAGGKFDEAGGITVAGIARWDGSAWSAVGSRDTGSMWTRALAVFDELHRGRKLFVGGSYQPTSDGFIDSWDGRAWLRGSINKTVYAMTEFDGGLIVGGAFTRAGGVQASHIARWEGPWNGGCTGREWVVSAACSNGELKIKVKGGNGREDVTIATLEQFKTVKTKANGKKTTAIAGSSCKNDVATVTWKCGAQATVPYRCD